MTEPPAAPRVVVVDADDARRACLRSVLQADGQVVIAEAVNGRDAVDLAVHFRPDVVVLGLVTANGDWLSATQAIAQRAPAVRVLLLTAHEELDVAMAGVRAGAAGHVSVDDGVAAAVRRAVAGEPVVGPQLTWRLIERVRALPPGGLGVRPVRSDLTPREWEVLDLLCAGLGIDEICDELVLARDTVRTHVKRLLRKLGAHSQAEAIAAANALRARFAPGLPDATARVDRVPPPSAAG